MSDNSASDQQLLKQIGLTDHDLRDMQAKHHAFYHSLNEAQKKSLTNSLPKAAEAAKTLGAGVAPEHLEQFIRARSPHAHSVVLFNRAGGDGS